MLPSSIINSDSSQLLLGVSLDDEDTFENYFFSGDNQLAFDALSQKEDAEQFIYIWSSESQGLTHLLKGACHQAAIKGAASLYIPLKEKSGLSPELLLGVQSLRLVCIDDIDCLDEEWEQALFTAFNACKETPTQLIVSARKPPGFLDIKLGDLHSRLQSGLMLQIKDLNDSEKLSLLKLRAENRGMKLPDAVAEFILLRADRSVAGLMKILDKLDTRSLQEKRSLTVPLVKKCMGW